MEQFPNKDEIIFKPEFEKRYKSLLGEDYTRYKEYTLSFLRRSIRVNTIKITISRCKGLLEKRGWSLTQVPWCKEGFWVQHETGRRDIGCTLEYKLGYFYVQEASSMIPPLVLDPKPGEIILDMCASPGSKTTQIGQYMENTGLLISNDINGKRMSALGLNVERMGISNCVITMMKGQWFAKSGIRFDRILLDAPCSGTGSIRKSLGTLRRWNPNAIKRLAREQKQLILVAYDLLKPGGTMVYSTCSNEPHEDEAVVDYLLKERKAKLEKIELKINMGKPVLDFEGETYSDEISKTLRIWPQDNDSEGFYVAKIEKP